MLALCVIASYVITEWDNFYKNFLVFPRWCEFRFVERERAIFPRFKFFGRACRIRETKKSLSRNISDDYDKNVRAVRKNLLSPPSADTLPKWSKWFVPEMINRNNNLAWSLVWMSVGSTCKENEEAKREEGEMMKDWRSSKGLSAWSMILASLEASKSPVELYSDTLPWLFHLYLSLGAFRVTLARFSSQQNLGCRIIDPFFPRASPPL